MSPFHRLKRAPISVFLWAVLATLATHAGASGQPVVSGHPRIFLTSADKTRLLVKVNANDPDWLAVKARADQLATFSIFPFKYEHRSEEPDGTIFYDYEGEGWYSAAFPLAFAFQMTGDTRYSDKLLQLADEMIRAESDPDNNIPDTDATEGTRTPLKIDDFYPTRNLGPALAIIFDWCYNQLGATRKAQMIALMNTYFDEMRADAYERNDVSPGNYYGGHLICAAAMGYASFGDNPRAQEMIDYARIRLDGTPGNVAPSDVPTSTIAQAFEGGYKSGFGSTYSGVDGTGAPLKGGFDFQGWAYGSGEYNRLIDYLVMVKSATGEDLYAKEGDWLSGMYRIQKHSLMPNRYEIDPTGDWGGFEGGIIFKSLPLRLAYVLAGSPDGPAAQHFVQSEIAALPEAFQPVFQPESWEPFFYSDPSLPSAEGNDPPYYSGFSPVFPQAGATNGAMPYFFMRSDFGPSATWASVQMGSAYWGDHQHRSAGHLLLRRADDYLLIHAGEWHGKLGTQGVEGGSTEDFTSAAANTFFFDDHGEYMSAESDYAGGQGDWGQDQVIAAEQTLAYSYLRSDLSSAYNFAGSDVSEISNRKLDFFYRSFLYLRDPDLFVVYDQTQNKAPTDPNKPYLKALRWHFPNVPTIQGNHVTMDQGASRLYLDTLLPANATITATFEPLNSETEDERIDVQDPTQPLFVPFLTALQPGTPSTPRMVSSNIASADSLMIGVRIEIPSGPTEIILLNNRSGQVPAPITSTSYAFAGPLTARHTLMGVVPGATYSVTDTNGTVTVTQSASGTVTASPAGVLSFTLSDLGPLPGDLNGDGQVTAVDLNRAIRIFLGLAAPSAAELKAGDLLPVTSNGHGDGQIRADDLNALLQLFLKVSDG